jgi:hypothetical protein
MKPSKAKPIQGSSYKNGLITDQVPPIISLALIGEVEMDAPKPHPS